MGLESASFISGLVTSNPIGATDPKSQGDDHLRLIKSVLQASFPDASRAFRFEKTLVKSGAYTIVAADDRTLVLGDATSAAFSVTLLAAATAGDGYTLEVKKTDSSGNAVTVAAAAGEKIDRADDVVLASQDDTVSLRCDASTWHRMPPLGTVAVKNTGVANDQVPLMDATGYPAADGSQITGLVNVFPAGTLMLFQQTAAPTGWTKQSTHNDKALRVVTGTAGSAGATAFTSVFGASKVTGSHVLTIAEMPAHTHTTGSGASQANRSGPDNPLNNSASVTGSTGGDGGHDHTLSLDLQYVDVIIASKD